jgi:prepilin-type N-terminal cleavage/methylation domain-containing protein
MKTEAGFTLIEVLIAMAIISFGLLSLASMQVVAVQVNSNGNRLTQGTTLVQDKIEELMALPFTDPKLSDTTAVGTCQTHTEPTPPPGYTLNWCVDNTTASSKTITVTATWDGQKRFELSFIRNTFQ